MMAFVFTLCCIYSPFKKSCIHIIWGFTLNLTTKAKINQPITNRILTKVFCSSDPNLVILAWMGHKLSCWKLGVDTKWTLTNAGNVNTRRPKLALGKTKTTTFAFWEYPPPPTPMTTNTIDSYCVPSQNKTKSKLQIKKKLPKIHILEFCKTRYVDGTPTSEVTPVTIRYIHQPHHGYP